MNGYPQVKLTYTSPTGQSIDEKVYFVGKLGS